MSDYRQDPHEPEERPSPPDTIGVYDRPERTGPSTLAIVIGIIVLLLVVYLALTMFQVI